MLGPGFDVVEVLAPEPLELIDPIGRRPQRLADQSQMEFAPNLVRVSKPACSSTRMCLETATNEIANGDARAAIVISPCANRATIARRVGSDRAKNKRSSGGGEHLTIWLSLWESIVGVNPQLQNIFLAMFADGQHLCGANCNLANCDWFQRLQLVWQASIIGLNSSLAKIWGRRCSFSRGRCACFALTLCVCALLRSASAAQPNSARPIELDVDATEAPRRLFRARLAIPVQPGPLTLVYPKWIPGEHGPTGPIGNLAGLKIEASGKLLQWQRDDVDLYAFHVIVPDGANELKVALECLEPAKSSSGSGNDGPTENLALVLWYKLILYPLGQPVHDIPVHARLTVPAGWKVGTALPMESDSGATIRFQRVSLEKLADSPALCGRFLAKFRWAQNLVRRTNWCWPAIAPKALKSPPKPSSNYNAWWLRLNRCFAPGIMAHIASC